MATPIEQLIADANRRRALPSPPVRRLLREEAGLTQKEIAAAIGVARPAVTRYESGTRAPRGETRSAYIELLERLVSGDGS